MPCIFSLCALMTLNGLLPDAAGAPPGSPEQIAQPAQAIEHSLPLTTQHPPEFGRKYRRMNLLPELTVADLDRIRFTLTLSDEQFAWLQTLFEQYEQENKAFQEEHLRELWKLSAEAAEYGPPIQSDSKAADVHAQLMQAQERYNQQAGAIEQKMFDGLMPTLTEAQQARMPRIGYQRTRATLTSVTLRASHATADLSALLHELEPVDPLDHEAYLHAITEYERRAAQLLQSHARAQEQASTRGVALRIKGDAQGSLRLLLRASREALKLAELNQRYVKQFNKLLAESKRERFM